MPLPLFRSLGVGDYSKERSARTGDGVLAVLVHGDGAFTGQVSYEGKGKLPVFCRVVNLFVFFCRVSFGNLYASVKFPTSGLVELFIWSQTIRLHLLLKLILEDLRLTVQVKKEENVTKFQ